MSTSAEPIQAPSTPVIRVVIADDHPVVRQGLGALISSLQGFAVVGEASDGENAIQ